MHAVIVAIALARAEPPPPSSPARQCATAATGSEVEVCLRLAVEHPDAVDEIASALVARFDRVEAPDRALLDALLLLGGDRAPDAARLLGTLGDPRALPVLVDLVDTREPPVSTAAVAALAGWPEAVPLVARWLVDDERPDAVRLAAADALREARRPEAADALEDALRRPRLPPAVRLRIVAALEGGYPGRTRPERIPPSTDGAPWLAAGAGLGLGYVLGTAGHFGRAGDLWAAGALAGGVTGATSGWLYGSAWPLEAADAAFVTVNGAGGTAAGLLLGSGAAPGDADVPLLVGLGGEVVGFSLGAAFATAHRGSTADALEAGAVSALAGGTAALAATFVREAGWGEPSSATAAGIGVIGGLTLGHAAAPLAELEDPRGLGLVATGGAIGLSLGLLAPIGAADRGVLPAASGLGGAAVGALLCGVFEPRSDVLIGVWTGGAFGVTIGGGLGLLTAPDTPDLARGFALAGLAAGAGGGALTAWADPDPIDDRDVAVSLAATGWAAWNAGAIGRMIGDDSPRARGALLLATSGAGGLATALATALDVPVPYTLTATSLGLLGGYAGGATGALLGLDPIVLALPLSDAGLLAGAVLVSPLVSTPPLVIGLAEAGGVAGASFAALSAGLASDDRQVVLGASVGGGVVGFAAGAIVGTVWHRSGARRDVAFALPRVGGISIGPLPVTGGAGAAVRVDGW